MSAVMRRQEVANSILVVDDEEPVRWVIREMIMSEGYECFVAENATKALDILAQKRVDLLITDINMPGMSGIELSKIAKERYGVDSMVMTGYVAEYAYEDIIEQGASEFIQKPVSPKELQLRIKRILQEQALREERDRAEHDRSESSANLEKALYGIVNTMAATVEIRDPYTAGHQRRVADLSRAIAQKMGFTEDRINGIHLAGMVHDLGKLSVPAEILSKPSQLTAIEFSLIKIHSEKGYEILKNIDFPWPIARLVYQHHERADGSGYPQGLPGDDMLFGAKILNVADTVEAMASHRPYRPGLGIETALDEISDKKGILYDPDVVDTCIWLFQKGGYKLVSS